MQIASYCLTLWTMLFTYGLFAAPATAQPLHLDISGSLEQLSLGELVQYTVTASNESNQEIENVEVDILLPDFIEPFDPPPGLSCDGSSLNTCGPGSLLEERFGEDISPGQALSFVYAFRVAASAPVGAVLQQSASAGGDGLGAGLGAAARSALIAGELGGSSDPSPDLIPTNLVVSPAEGFPGSSTTVSFTVQNIGSGDAPATQTNVRLSTSPTEVTTTDPLLATLSTPAVEAQSQVSQTVEITIPAILVPGPYYVWVILDADGTSGQSNEENDLANTPFTVTGGGTGWPIDDGYAFVVRVIDGETGGDTDVDQVVWRYRYRQPQGLAFDAVSAGLDADGFSVLTEAQVEDITSGSGFSHTLERIDLLRG